MDAVPTLCATSTVGVAALGFAFGRLPTAESRPRSRRRQVVDKVSDRFSQIFAPPATPGDSGQAVSAPTTRLSKPNVLRRPQSSSFPTNTAQRAKDGLGGVDSVDREDWRVSVFDRREDPSGNQAVSTPRTKAGASTVRSSWLRRMSTMSSLHTESLWSTSRPGTPSLSFSNASSTPIMPSNAAPVTPRNKLVKRATSQRILHNSGFDQTGYSKATLRRPATSHQRSANLREQLFLDPVPLQHDVSRPSFQDDDLVTSDRGADVVEEHYQPLFRRRMADFSKEATAKPAVGARTTNRYGYVQCVVPVAGDKAVLLKAASIVEIAKDELTPLPSTPVQPEGSLSPRPMNSSQTLSSSTSRFGGGKESDPKPRSSFAISDCVPSPSPSAWKMSRIGSLRRKKGTEGSISGRRTTSAPQALERRSPPHAGQPGSATRHHASTSLFHSKHASSPTLQSSPHDPMIRSPSSPLPPLNRSSTFEIDLLETTVSHPPSPGRLRNSSPSSQTSPSLAVFPNSNLQTAPRSRAHRPSGAPSDRASTLISSDNDNSRIFSIDGDELDYRSETMYDSVRTGATGSSHSGVKGARIESVFENPPPPELLKQNLAALQEKLSNSNPFRDFIAEEEESLRTPVHMAQSYEDNLPTPSRYPTHLSSPPDFASSPPIPLNAALDGQVHQGLHNPHADEVWGFDGDESTSWNNSEKEESSVDHELWSTAAGPAPDYADLHLNSVPLEHNDSGERPKSSLFEWSERSHLDSGDLQGFSPRPKTAHGKQSTERGSRSAGRRGASGLHLRSQSVPLSPENNNHRKINNAAKLDAWILGNKGVSEDWDNDFEFDEPVNLAGPSEAREGKATAAESHGMLVPRAILERQASVHGQFGQVKELTQLVEELRSLRHQASEYGIIQGQASELWKEAEGIIDLATLDEEEQDYQMPRSPGSPSFEFDGFDDESPTSQRRPMSHLSDVSETPTTYQDRNTPRHVPSQSAPTPTNLGTPIQGRNRKDSVAKAKSVLEHIHQQRSSLDPPLEPTTKSTQKKLPFDTTSLRDLVTRAGVVTRALKEIIRRVENPHDPFPLPDRRPSNPPDPLFSQIFHQPHSSPSSNRSPRMGHSSSHNSFLGGSMTGNDNDINGHMKIMTVA
ncbi:hypothetical protein MMC26_005584 [Xylographa opegraphella]|nr:hypothetical protein [Xylographa opegraphella]